jgi:hypothetical protein
MRHAAPLIRAAIASLQTGMPDRISVFNTEPENEVELVPIDGDAYFFGGKPDSDPRYPCIEVAITAIPMRGFSVGQVDFDVRPVGMVAAWAQGPPGDTPAIYETVLGYGRCILEVLLQPDAWGASVTIDPEEGARSDYASFDLELDEQPVYRALGLHTFTLEDVDRRP